MAGNRAKKLTKQLANQIVQLLHDGRTQDQVMSELSLNNSAFWKDITMAIFGLPDVRTPEHQILRDGIFDVLLGETLLKRVLEVSGETTKKKKIVVTTLLSLTSPEVKALERMGHEAFVEQFEGSAVNLKVEETTEIIPPEVKLLEGLLKLAEGNVSVQNALKQLTPFNPVDPELEEEV